MLGAHSRCLTTPESKFNIDVYFDSVRNAATPFPPPRAEQAAGLATGFAHTPTPRSGSGLRSWPTNNIDLLAALDKIKIHLDFRAWGIDIDSADFTEVAQCEDYPQLIQWLVKQYAQANGSPAPKIWIDHTPFNIVYAPILFALFPDTKMIHLVRDGRAVASSVMKLDWGPSCINTAAHWYINRVAHGLAAESSFGPDRVRQFRYEDLILQPQTTLHEICRFLEIDFEPDIITGRGLNVPQYVAEQHPLIAGAPDAKRIHAWKTELSARQIEIFESIAGQMLHCLGYELSFGWSSKPAGSFELFRLGLRELYRSIIVNKMHRQWRIRQVNRGTNGVAK